MDLGLILLTRNIASTKSSAVQNKRLTIRIYGFSSGPVMKSTARLIIVISLAINRKLSFSDLLTITALGKGSLGNHLGTKAVRLDRYLQRRAWGVYYSIWAVSILLFTFLSQCSYCK